MYMQKLPISTQLRAMIRRYGKFRLKLDLSFKVDTGAEVTALSDSTWKSFDLSSLLKKPEISLCGLDHSHP